MKIKLQTQHVNSIFYGLCGLELFMDHTVGTKILEYKSADYMKEDALPEEPEVKQDWKFKKEVIKIRSC